MMVRLLFLAFGGLLLASTWQGKSRQDINLPISDIGLQAYVQSYWQKYLPPTYKDTSSIMVSLYQLPLGSDDDLEKVHALKASWFNGTNLYNLGLALRGQYHPNYQAWGLDANVLIGDDWLVSLGQTWGQIHTDEYSQTHTGLNFGVDFVGLNVVALGVGYDGILGKAYVHLGLIF